MWIFFAFFSFNMLIKLSFVLLTGSFCLKAQNIGFYFLGQYIFYILYILKNMYLKKYLKNIKNILIIYFYWK